ncbi:MAG: hypothetical protein CMF62_04215 [Magnetococcales bacterium]|nr:hypothetical protein [Magnetococcales bacterium]|tara:strand:+ start:1741 stop:2499 length:759 start_codon:yes stop_codon:yes gene_type:complete
MKRLAVCLFGIAHKDGYKHFNKKMYKIDYQESLNNYREQILDYFIKKNYEVDYFYSTYSSSKDQKLSTDIKPKRSVILTNWIRNRIFSRNTHFINSLKSCIEYSRDTGVMYDHILIIRFDLLIKESLDSVNFNPDKLNLVSILEKPNLIDDNIYLLPFDLANGLLKVAIKNKSKMYHFIKNDLEEEFQEINYLKNDKVSVPDLSYYDIVRNIHINKNNIKIKKIDENNTPRKFPLNPIKNKKCKRGTNLRKS